MSVRIIIGDVREKKPGPVKGYRFSAESLKTRKKTTAALKGVLLCRECGHSWVRVEQKINQCCPCCGSPVDARLRKGSKRSLASLKAWRLANPEKARETAKAGRDLMRRSALMLIGGGSLKCVNCGCDLYDALEINHKNGGGRAELIRLKAKFYRDIARRLRSADDLEICCRVCNALDYLERKLGTLPFTIVWGSKQ